MKKLSRKEYLYGEGVDVEPIPEHVVMRRIEALKEHLDNLLEHSCYTRDTRRCNEVFAAIKWWQNLDKDM